MVNVDYIHEAKVFLQLMYREEWMTDDDWQEFIRIYSEECKQLGNQYPSIEEHAEALKKGVDNGYSIEIQKEMLIEIIKNKSS
ncbi:hypothetical protein OWR28_02540 [Chryseobacterium sp. 1B4]